MTNLRQLAYSEWDFIEDITKALGVDVPPESADKSFDLANICLKEIARLKKREQGKVVQS